MLEVDKCHADALVDRQAVIACGDFADGFAVFQYGIAVAWNGFVFEFDTDEFLAYAICFLLFDGFFSDELILVELAEALGPAMTGEILSESSSP